MKKFYLAYTAIFTVVNLFVLYKGVAMYVATNGTVRGSEFGMLITLSNMLSLLMIWLVCFAFYIMIRHCYKAKCNTKIEE